MDLHVLLQLFFSAMLAILFVQSGIDKVLNYKDNLDWLTGHFKNSFLNGTVPILLPVITVVELAAGLSSALCIAMLVLGQKELGVTAGQAGAGLSCIALIMLFFGQRFAKDYAGAANLVPYFLLSAAAYWLYL